MVYNNTSNTIISEKPINIPIIPNEDLIPSCILGTNSSNTTCNIHPEANANKNGSSGTTIFNKTIVNNALIGSTIPDNTPSKNDLPFLFPSNTAGNDIIAPSGIF